MLFLNRKPVPPRMNKADREKAESFDKIEAPALRFLSRLHTFIHPKGVKEVLKLKIKEDDVILLTPPKCGTTWTQMILHQMRSGGDMNFDALDIECPYMEAAYGLGVNIHKKQRFSPRVYKTHLLLKFLDHSTGKYIFIARNPADAGISFYHFCKNWYFTEDEIPLNFYVKNMWCKMKDSAKPEEFASIWHHYVHTYKHRKDPNVLWIHYEDMKENIDAAIKLISDFVGISVDDKEFFDMVKERSSMAYMKKFPEKFDIHEHKIARNPYLGLPHDAGMDPEKNEGLVRSGKVGGGNSLESDTVQALDKKWAEVCEPAIGFKDYDEMRYSINKELGRPFKSSKY